MYIAVLLLLTLLYFPQESDFWKPKTLDFSYKNRIKWAVNTVLNIAEVRSVVDLLDAILIYSDMITCFPSKSEVNIAQLFVQILLLSTSAAQKFFHARAT